MTRWMRAAGVAAVLAGSAALGLAPAAAQTVMQQCGQQYQAAKAAGSLGGQTWNQYRTECAARMKAQPASATDTTPTDAAAGTSAAAPANPLKPSPAVAATPAAAPAAPSPAAAPSGKQTSPGRVAFVARERQCGTEWKANKAALVAQTPGLTWPKYLSQCNTRLKAAGQ